MPSSRPIAGVSLDLTAIIALSVGGAVVFALACVLGVLCYVRTRERKGEPIWLSLDRVSPVVLGSEPSGTLGIDRHQPQPRGSADSAHRGEASQPISAATLPSPRRLPTSVSSSRLRPSPERARVGTTSGVCSGTGGGATSNATAAERAVAAKLAVSGHSDGGLQLSGRPSGQSHAGHALAGLAVVDASVKVLD